ncbi:pimeloyl-ACP methyl ester carboxylesterase [Nocardioides cavernae]|uniref:Pimeloyl-ACP methyl ester carboxylesterase n=1 Tax=Nocardioides cavernae TaxID=1921566 RepID=A0A7Y9H0U5_9ACTN|nr:alpha/beta hydrolase [Nocardioides cavernae]NYE35837.1 pimeloyl-ACP methyl ester carboxylesterase [Nocardioides cavernae]
MTTEPAADAQPRAGRGSYDAVASRSVAPGAPDWFHAAMAAERHAGTVDVDGTSIGYLSWGPQHGPATVLVHGGAAHAMWWAPLAARLDVSRRVVAMDLSGHGTSDWRPTYSGTTWADEIAAVAAATSEGPATVVGHSLGGIVLADLATRRGRQLERILLVDSPVWPTAPEPEGALTREAGRRSRTYPDLATALARFRLVPAQRCANQWYVDHIARHGLVRVDGGWTWRFDPQVFVGRTGARQIVRFEGDLDDAACPWSLVMGSRSYLADGAAAAFSGRRGSDLRFVDDAAHHVMLDQPLALLGTLQELLGT